MGGAFGQVPPDAGRIQEQLRIPEPRRPAAPPAIRIEKPAPGPQAQTAPFRVERFRISGATAFSEPELLRLLGEPRRHLTLAQVQALVERVTRHYQDHGYVVARAFVPAQDVRNGVVEVAVLEGRYGRIEINNASEVSESRLRALLGGVRELSLVHGPTLERAVLLLSDMAGIEPKATLEPGEQTGLTNLILEVVPAAAYEADVTVDNAGSRFTGRNRLTAGLLRNSPLGIGDRLGGRIVVSDDRLFAVRLSYEAPLGASGLRGTAYLSHAAYELGDAFASLEQEGTASAAGVSLAYPVVRSTALNVRLLAGGEARDLEDDIGVLGVVNRKRVRVLQAGIAGDARDATLAGAVSGFQILLSAGHLDLRPPSLQQADAQTAGTEGGFTKLAFSANRVQALTQALRASLVYVGQHALHNLDSSEKLSIGGVAGVRAYPIGETPGDEAHIVQAEARYQAGGVLGGQLTPMVFADWAWSRLNHKTWAGFTGTNERTLKGYGFGAEWGIAGSMFMRGLYARRIGDEPATAEPDRKDRFWLQIGLLL